MFTLKKKWWKRLRGLLGAVIAALLITSALGITALAATATMPDMSDMIPDGTNIPDTDIGGATGNDSSMLPGTDSATESDSMTPSATRPDTSGGIVTPSTNAGTSAVGDDDGSDTVGGIIGIIIAVIVVIAIIMLIIALVPRRPGGTMRGNDGKGEGADTTKKK